MPTVNNLPKFDDAYGGDGDFLAEIDPSKLPEKPHFAVPPVFQSFRSFRSSKSEPTGERRKSGRVIPADEMPKSAGTKLNEAEEHRLTEKLREFALTLVEHGDRFPEWQRYFALTRVLRSMLAHDEPSESIRKWARVFAGMVPWQESVIIAGVEGNWDIVRFGVGQDSWSSAWDRAADLHHDFQPAPEPEWHRLVTALWILHAEAGGDAFPIPCKRIAGSLGVSESMASRIRSALVRRKIITLFCADYSYKKKKSQTFTFTAIPRKRGEL